MAASGKLANSYIETCKITSDNPPNYTSDTDVNNARKFFYSLYADAYNDIAEANIHFNNPSKALWASDKCIEYNYEQPECHLSKALALIQLKQTDKVLVVLDETAELIKIRISENKQEIANLTDDSLRSGVIHSFIFYESMLKDVEKLQRTFSAKVI